MLKNKYKINGFKYPAADKLSGRISTICRSMACTLLERKGCSVEDEGVWLRFFPDRKCAYCGKDASHLDHLYALIFDQKPTGYGTEPANLVPCCGGCNQSKGNKNWDKYMQDLLDKAQTESERCEIKTRIDNIHLFQQEMPPKKVEISDDIMRRWDGILQDFDRMLREAEAQLKEMSIEIYKK